MGAKVWHRLVLSVLGIVGAYASLVLRGRPAASTASDSAQTGVVGPRPAPSRGVAGAWADRPDRGARPTRTTLSTAPVPIGTWRALGPAPIGPPYLANGGFYGGANSGRITAITKLPASGLHPGRIVLGSAGGGIWTSDDNGVTWLPRTDAGADLAIGAVAADPANANHLVAGTGEANQ